MNVSLRWKLIGSYVLLALVVVSVLGLALLGETWLNVGAARWPERPPAPPAGETPVHIRALMSRLFQTPARVGSIAGALSAQEAYQYDMRWTRAENDSANLDDRLRVWSAMGVRYIAVPAPENAGAPPRLPAPLHRIYHSNVDIYENPDAAPRVTFIAAGEAVVTSPTQWIALRASPAGFHPTPAIVAPADPRRRLSIEGPLSRRHAAVKPAPAPVQVSNSLAPMTSPTVSGGSPPATTGTVTPHPHPVRTPPVHAAPFVITHDGRHKMGIDGHAAEAGWLVLSDRFYPGWFVFVDGKWERIYRANGIFRAVFVKQGKRHVTFLYLPWTLAAGMAGSLWTLRRTVRIYRRAKGGVRSTSYGSPIEYVSIR